MALVVPVKPTLLCVAVCRYPFERPKDRGDVHRFQKVLQRILVVDYVFPAKVAVSKECKDLLSKILVADPNQRITVAQASSPRSPRPCSA